MKGLIFLTLLVMASIALPIDACADNSINYPDRAWKLNQTGEVIVVYDIDANGKPANVRIEHSDPKFLFDDSVKAQIYRWKFPKEMPQKDVRLRMVFTKK